MKKRFLFILPFLFLTVVSCGLKDLIGTEPGSVSFQLGNKVTSQLARNIFADTTADKTVDITVTISDDYDAEETQNIDLATTDTILFTFDNIPGGSTVTIDIVVTRSSDKAEMYKGSAEGVKIEAGKITPVSVTLKPVAKVEELIPTIEILLGEKAEVQASLSLLEILGEYFLPSDTKAEKYNYYSNLYEDEAFIEDKDLKFRVDNWDAAYKVTLNDTELKVDDKNYIAYADVLAAAVTGTNSIKVTKDEKSSEAGKFDVVCGIYDVKPLVVVGTGEDSFWLEDGEKDIRLGVDANNGVEPVVFYSFDPYVREVTSAEEAAKALFSGKFNIKYSVTVEGKAAEVTETKQTVEALFGEYEFTCNTALIPAKAKKNVVLKAVFEIPEAYLEKDASGKATEVSTTASFVTSYDVTSKGSVYLSDYKCLYYFPDGKVPASFTGYEGEDSVNYVSGSVNDYCFDEYGNVIYSDGSWFNTVEKEVESTDSINSSYLAYDYDNARLYGLSVVNFNVGMYTLDSNGEYKEIARGELPELYNEESLAPNSKQSRSLPFAVKDDILYIASVQNVDGPDNTYQAEEKPEYYEIPVIQKLKISNKSGELTFTDLGSYRGLPQEIVYNSGWIGYKGFDVTDVTMIGDELYVIINQNYKNYDGVFASRGCVLEFDEDLLYPRVIGWEKGNALTLSSYLYGKFSSRSLTGDYSFSKEKNYEQLFLDEARTNPFKLEYTHTFYAATNKNSGNFIGPERFVALEPKKLVINEQGAFVYVKANDFAYIYTAAFTTVNLEDFALGRVYHTPGKTKGSSSQLKNYDDDMYDKKVYAAGSCGSTVIPMDGTIESIGCSLTTSLGWDSAAQFGQTE